MIPRDPTAEDVLALAAYLGERFHFRVERKDHSEICRLVAKALEALSIQSAEAFLGSYVTTLPDLTGGTGSVVYVPFDVGVPEQWGCRAQHDILVHEATHALQWNREGAVYACRYLASQYDRAIYEAVAYCTRGELASMRGDALPAAADLAEHLRAYGCGQAAIEACRLACESLLLTAAQGGRSEVGRAVEEWWAGRAVSHTTDGA